MCHSCTGRRLLGNDTAQQRRCRRLQASDHPIWYAPICWNHAKLLIPEWIFDDAPKMMWSRRFHGLSHWPTPLGCWWGRWDGSPHSSLVVQQQNGVSVEQETAGWEPVKQKFKEHRFGLLPLLKLFSHRTLPSRTQWRRIISRGKRICGPPAKGARSKVKGSTFKNRSELDQYWISAYKLGVL